MKIGFWTREDTLLKNYIFFNKGIDASFNISHNNWLNFYNFLKKNGHEINSIDIIKNIEVLDCVIFLDFPAGEITELAKKALSHKKKILITFENEVVLKNNWLKKNHKLFDIILTWNDDYIDNKKYFKIMIPGLSQHNKSYEFLSFNDKKNLSCMITWKKKYYHKNSTQFIKKKIINYFEKNNFTNDFHLYGPNWNETVFSYSSIFKFLNYPRFKLLRKMICFEKLSTWKGLMENKKKNLRNYKFSFIIENAINYNGYMSDKIFECFYAGTVPIYLGATNVNSYIPNDCFIDFRKFKDMSQLHNYLINVDQQSYDLYIDNIKNFLKNKNIIFTIDHFNQVLLDSLFLLLKK